MNQVPLDSRCGACALAGTPLNCGACIVGAHGDEPSTGARIVALAALSLAALLWGSSFFFIHRALAGFDPWTTTFTRCLVGGLVVGGAARLLEAVPGGRVRISTAAARRSIVIAGLCTAGALLGVALGQRTVTSSVAGIVLGTVPVWTTAIVLVRGARNIATRGLVAGIALGLVATVVPAFGATGHTAPVAGLGLLLAAAICHGSSMAFVADAVASFGPMRATSLVMLIAALVLAIPMLTFGAAPRPNLAAFIALTEISLLPTGVAYIAFFRAVAVLGAPRASVAIYLVPAIALIVGTGIGGEPLGVSSVVGAATAFAAVAVTVLDGRSPSSTTRRWTARDIRATSPINVSMPD